MSITSVQDVITLYLNKIKELGYYIIIDSFECPARTDNFYNLLFINPKKLSPFIIVHEYYHILLKHSGRLTSFNGNDERNPNEYEANYSAIQTLLTIYTENYYEINYIEFMSLFSIPVWLESMVISIIKESQIS